LGTSTVETGVCDLGRIRTLSSSTVRDETHADRWGNINYGRKAGKRPLCRRARIAFRVRKICDEKLPMEWAGTETWKRLEGRKKNEELREEREGISNPEKHFTKNLRGIRFTGQY